MSNAAPAVMPMASHDDEQRLQTTLSLHMSSGRCWNCSLCMRSKAARRSTALRLLPWAGLAPWAAAAVAPAPSESGAAAPALAPAAEPKPDFGEAMCSSVAGVSSSTTYTLPHIRSTSRASFAMRALSAPSGSSKRHTKASRPGAAVAVAAESQMDTSTAMRCADEVGSGTAEAARDSGVAGDAAADAAVALAAELKASGAEAEAVAAAELVEDVVVAAAEAVEGAATAAAEPVEVPAAAALARVTHISHAPQGPAMAADDNIAAAPARFEPCEAEGAAVSAPAAECPPLRTLPAATASATGSASCAAAASAPGPVASSRLAASAARARFAAGAPIKLLLVLLPTFEAPPTTFAVASGPKLARAAAPAAVFGWRVKVASS